MRIHDGTLQKSEDDEDEGATSRRTTQLFDSGTGGGG